LPSTVSFSKRLDRGRSECCVADALSSCADAVLLGPLGGGIDAEGGGRELGSSARRCPRLAGLRGPRGASFGTPRGCPLAARGLWRAPESATSKVCSLEVGFSVGSIAASVDISSFSLVTGASLLIRFMICGRSTLQTISSTSGKKQERDIRRLGLCWSFDGS
jgi:hypothetical protein